jgi:hypothetical protein
VVGFVASISNAAAYMRTSWRNALRFAVHDQVAHGASAVRLARCRHSTKPRGQRTVVVLAGQAGLSWCIVHFAFVPSDELLWHGFRPNPHGGSLHQTHMPSPNVTRSTPWRGFGSKGWMPRTVVQRLGSFLSGAAFVATGVAFLLGSAGMKTELQSLLHRAGPAAGVLSVVGFVIAFVAGLSALSLGARLLTRSVWFRSDTRP